MKKKLPNWVQKTTHRWKNKNKNTKHIWLCRSSLTLYIWAIFWVLPHPQVVGLSGFPSQQVPDPLIVDLQVADSRNQRQKTWWPFPVISPLPHICPFTRVCEALYPLAFRYTGGFSISSISKLRRHSKYFSFFLSQTEWCCLPLATAVLKLKIRNSIVLWKNY